MTDKPTSEELRNVSYSETATKVGDTVFVASGGTWNAPTVRRFEVVRITKSGQIVAAHNGEEIRVNSRGNIVGEGAYGTRRIVSAKKAAEYIEQGRIEAAWQAIRAAASDVEKAARRKSDEELAEAMAKLLQAVADLTPETTP